MGLLCEARRSQRCVPVVHAHLNGLWRPICASRAWSSHWGEAVQAMEIDGVSLPEDRGAQLLVRVSKMGKAVLQVA